MELTDILSEEAWARFEKELSDRFHLNCTIYKSDGISVTVKQNFCNNLCPKIKANRDALAAICAPANQNLMARARQTRNAVIDECDAGLLKIAVPIFVGEEFLGTAGGCGVLLEGGEVEDFMIQKTTGLDEETIETLCRDLGSMTEDEARQAAAFIESRIAQLLKDASVSE
ncbi:MAG: PocR ligand-binding domain-containing protein [Deltaproteobacteria bacterium]|nr:PocR ligand-binding domain-containing protein [Deltaproteobacteria bacterium]